MIPPEESEEDMRKVIEAEVAGAKDPLERFRRLKRHTQELASRWAGFVQTNMIPASALIENDLFRALKVSLQMTVAAGEHGSIAQELRLPLERVLRDMQLLATAEPSDVGAFVRQMQTAVSSCD